MIKRPKISVVVITYNQQDTIAQTLDSILCQQGDFDLEVVIGEDASPDGTLVVCKDYANRYPNQRVLLSGEKNMGIMANSARVFKASTGDFVNIIAGDDYWCDDHKLQKQLDYFHTHPDVGVVSTSGYRHFVLRDEMVPGVAPLHPIENGDVKRFYFSSEYKGGLYAMPLTLLVKRVLLQYVDFDEFVRRCFPVEDLPMQAVLSHHCKWGHINDLCVVYRVYKESATFISFDHPNYLSYYKGLANIRRYLNELFPDDICFTEEWLQEYEFYREFLLYLHQKDYKKAKQLIIDIPSSIANSAKVKQAKRFTKTWLHFMAAHYIKEHKYHKDITERT